MGLAVHPVAVQVAGGHLVTTTIESTTTAAVSQEAGLHRSVELTVATFQIWKKRSVRKTGTLNLLDFVLPLK